MDGIPSEVGRGHVTARRLDDGATSLTEVRGASPLRFLQPTFPSTPRSAAVCLVTFGGGLCDGDDIDVSLDVGEGATLMVFTQASTKVFRGSARQSIRATVRGTLAILPDPVAPFGGARYRQRIDVALEGDGTCVLLDGFTSGRPAFGDRWAMERIDLQTRITRHGELLARDALVLDGDIGGRMDRFEALLTILAAGPRAASLVPALMQRAAHHPRTADVLVAPSVLAPCKDRGLPGAIVRIAATSPSRALAEARLRLRNLPDIDVVDPFESRS